MCLGLPGRRSGVPTLLSVLVAALAVAACDAIPDATGPLPRPAVPSLRFGLEVQAVRGDRPVTTAAAASAAPTTPEPTPSEGPTRTPGPSESPASTPTPAVSAPLVSSGSGGGSRPRPSAAPTLPPNFDGRVLDETERPVALAEVRTADGRSGTTGADGVFHIDGPMQAPVTVMAAGYATSTVQGLDFPTDLHVRSVSQLTAPAERDPHGIGGTIVWPLADLQAATVYYQDFGASRYTPGSVGLVDGRFGVLVRYRDVGRHGAVLLANGLDGAGAPLLGVSAPFDPRDDEGPAVTLHALTDSVSYVTSVIPAGLTSFHAQLELVQDGAPTTAIVDSAANTGSFAIPPAADLPGVLRLLLEARDGSGNARSSYTRVIDRAALSTTGRLLEVPTVTIDAPTRVITWSQVADVEGYQVEVYKDGFAGPVWEVWTTERRVEVDADAWPPAGTGDVIVRAVDAAGIGARQVASLPEFWPARQLRVEPWTEKPDFRTSSRAVRL